MFFKKISVLAVGGVLAGCAAPAISPADLEMLGSETGAAQWCVEQGTMPPDVGAMGRSHVRAVLSTRSFKVSDFEWYARQGYSSQPDGASCRQLAMTFHGRSNNYRASVERANAAAAYQQQINQNAPKTTWCNRFGQQVMCNTY